MDALLIFLVLVVFVGLRLWLGQLYARMLDEQPEKVREMLARMRDRGY